MPAAEPERQRELEIAPARPEDAQDIASLWAICFPDSVWTKLGGPLANVYFRRFCAADHELAVTARLNGALVGACIGTARPRTYVRAFYGEHALVLAWTFGRELLRRPGVAITLLGRVVRGSQRVIRRAFRSGHQNAAATRAGEAGIGACYVSDFFVAPAARGRQLGTLMLRCFCDEMTARGCESCVAHTTTDNVASQVAQTRAGFQEVSRQGDDLLFQRPLKR